MIKKQCGNFRYYARTNAEKQRIADSHKKYDFSDLKKGKAWRYKFTDKDLFGITPCGKSKYSNKAASIINCANHYARKNGYDRHYHGRLVYNEIGKVIAVDIVRVK